MSRRFGDSASATATVYKLKLHEATFCHARIVPWLRGMPNLFFTSPQAEARSPSMTHLCTQLLRHGIFSKKARVIDGCGDSLTSAPSPYMPVQKHPAGPGCASLALVKRPPN